MHRHCWPFDCFCMCSLLGSVPVVLFEPAFIQQRCLLLQADLLRGVAISGLSALPTSPSVLGGVPLGDSPLAQAFAVSDVACFCLCSLSWLISACQAVAYLASLPQGFCCIFLAWSVCCLLSAASPSDQLAFGVCLCLCCASSWARY